MEILVIEYLRSRGSLWCWECTDWASYCAKLPINSCHVTVAAGALGNSIRMWLFTLLLGF